MRRPCLACAAKDQTIAALADQVEWMRLHMGTPLLQRQHGVFGSTQSVEDAPLMGVRTMWNSEEEEDLQDLHMSGDISTEELERALAAIQATNTEIVVSN